MKAQVINYGPTGFFPTCLGNMWLERGLRRELSDPKAIKELSAFPMVDVKVVEGEEKSTVDYAQYPISQLRHIAAELGIKGTFSMKKVDLIKKLTEEKNHG